MNTKLYKFQPTPTEFRGYRFESRTEAMFAAFLFAMGIRFTPQRELGRRRVDFSWMNSIDETGRSRPRASEDEDAPRHFVVCEYKPTPPTRTYGETLLAELHDGVQPLLADGDRWELIIAMGSFYRPAVMQTLTWNGVSWWHGAEWQTFRRFSANTDAESGYECAKLFAERYRYDLA